MSKRVIPFSNGTEAMSWLFKNCDDCKTKCHFKRNIEDGFITGDITVKTAEFIGIATKFIESDYITLNAECQHKSNYVRKKKTKKLIGQLSLFE